MPTTESPPATRWKPNVTVAAIIERDGRFLLVEEQTPSGLKLNNPAGHLEPGETLAQACAREALEETAHHFEPTALIGVYLARSALGGQNTTWLRFAFAGTLGAHESTRPLDEGIARTLWMTPEEIRASIAHHRTPLLLQCIEDFLAGQRHPLALIHADASLFANHGTMAR